MATDFAAFVDPFLGNFETSIDKRPPGTPAAGWQWLKAWPGNTHPGACRPFGLVTACAYTGGYPTGYGVYECNCSGLPGRLLDRHAALGFTHFHHSGTGMIEEYYNYLLVTPVAGAWPGGVPVWDLVDEQAAPGWYAATLGHGGARGEVTVTPHGAAYRFTCPAGAAARVRLDLAFSYRDDPRFFDQLPRRGFQPSARIPTGSAVARVVNGAGLEGTIQTPAGLPLHFFCVLRDAGPQSRWTRDDGQALSADATQPASGVQITGPAGANTLRLDIGFSLHSPATAAENCRRELAGLEFDQVVAQSREEWNRRLAAVRIDSPSAQARQVFYSALYHSPIKPVDATGDHAFWADGRPLFLDYATLWDQGKTQLPLVMMLYPDRARDMIEALVNIYEHVGRPANMVLLRPLESLLSADGQGFALSYPTIARAAAVGVPGVDWKRALRVLERALPADNPPEGKAGIDFALAAFSLAQVARAAGDQAAADRWAVKADHWKQQCSKPGGKICKGWFYEGQAWTYSFAVWHDIAGLIDYCGGRENLVADLDAFFCLPGARLRPVHAQTFGSDTLPEDQRFEGLNNEPDMEVPYIYAYLGEHDRLSDVVRTVMLHRYKTGRGGLPGNDDSGGLSSWYVWSALGLFPAIAQGLYLIGSPLFARAEIDVHGGTFVITTEGNDPIAAACYVQSATLDGREIDRPYLRSTEVRAGGHLHLRMGPARAGWGKDVPPSPDTGSESR